MGGRSRWSGKGETASPSPTGAKSLLLGEGVQIAVPRAEDDRVPADRWAGTDPGADLRSHTYRAGCPVQRVRRPVVGADVDALPADRGRGVDPAEVEHPRKAAASRRRCRLPRPARSRSRPGSPCRCRPPRPRSPAWRCPGCSTRRCFGRSRASRRCRVAGDHLLPAPM